MFSQEGVIPNHESKRVCVCVLPQVVSVIKVKKRKRKKKEGNSADGFQLVDNFLLLYASVLEPYGDLSLGQVGLS